MVVAVLDIDREGSVLIGIEAPRHVRVDRLEVRRRVDPGWCRPDRRPNGEGSSMPKIRSVRELAGSISCWVDSDLGRRQIYRCLVASIAEPGALEQIFGVDPELDRVVEQWSEENLSDPAAGPVRV